MHIRDVAERTGLSAHTIRFYEKSGVLPKVHRSVTGVREFKESDVTFLDFVSALRKTGMSLQDIREFTQDGCILELLQSNDMPVDSVKRRITILKNHHKKLEEQQHEIEILIEAVKRKLEHYDGYLVRQSIENKETPS